MGARGMKTGGGIGGTVRQAYGGSNPAQRRDESKARRELSRGMTDVGKARTAFEGRTAHLGPLWNEQMEAAGSRLKDTDRAFQTIFSMLMGGAGATGEVGGLGQSMLARQREGISRAGAQSERGIRENMAMAGMQGRSGLQQRLLGQNALQTQGMRAQAETDTRARFLNQLQNFQGQQQQAQLGRFGMAAEYPYKETDMLNQYLQALLGGRQGMSGLFNTQAARTAQQQEAWNQRVHELAMSWGGGPGGRGGG